MARHRSSELWDEPDEPQEEEAEETWEAKGGRRAASSSSEDGDWEEDDSSGWLDDTLDDLESEVPQGCDEGEVYRLLGRQARRGRDD